MTPGAEWSPLEPPKSPEERSVRINMPVDHTEKGFEQAIEDHLLHHGYRNGDPANFDASLALDTKTLVEFLGVTQKGCDRASAKDFHEIRAVFTRRVA